MPSAALVHILRVPQRPQRARDAATPTGDTFGCLHSPGSGPHFTDPRYAIPLEDIETEATS
jgi:hypothetical protein